MCQILQSARITHRRVMPWESGTGRNFKRTALLFVAIAWLLCLVFERTRVMCVYYVL